MRNSNRFRYCLKTVLLFSCFIFASCGGDGAATGTLSDDPAGSSQAPSASSPNGNLRGQIVIDGKAIDLATGQTIQVVSPSANDRSNSTDLLVTPTTDGQEFLRLRYSCQVINLISHACLETYDAAGIELDQFLVREGAEQLPRVSQDKRYVAVLTEYPDRFMNLFDRSGVLINGRRNYVRDAAWAPDSSVYYTRGRFVVKIPANELASTQEDVFSGDTFLSTGVGDGYGLPSEISVSPDGRQIVFARWTKSNAFELHSTIWIMNSDGTDLRLFAQAPDGQEDGMTDPVWSPDGNYILVRLRLNDVGTDSYTSGGLVALDSSLSNYTLGEGSDQQIGVRATCFQDPEDCDQTNATLFNTLDRVSAWIE